MPNWEPLLREIHQLKADWAGSLGDRPGQRPPAGDWRVFLLLGGRGAGKTRTAAELVRHWVETGSAHRIGLIGATAADVRDTMIQGPSGSLSCWACAWGCVPRRW